MKKFFATLILASSICAPAFAQSLEETQKWLLAKALDSKFASTQVFSFGEGTFESETTPAAVYNKKTYNRSIPLKDVKTISVLQGDGFVSFTLSCDYECAYEETVDYYDKKFISEKMKNYFLFEIYGNPNPTLNPRIEKALLKLVELNGGKAKIVAPEKEKEPF